MKWLSFLTCLLFLSFPAFSQTSDCDCCTEKHQAFDFWIGEWNVYDTLGTKIGENHILKLEDNCILQENWKGGKGTTGSSYNYFNKTDKTWNQLWVDNSGNHLILKGNGNGKQMTMESELVPGKKVAFYRNQVIWTLNEDQTVTQTWNYLDEEGNLLATVFKGIYKKKS